ncbi:MAG: TonB-dependent receptor, partial [Acidobacteria bacterium]|nr:TonB-dependent receptor [Acidobacteriota bacterium]
AAYHATTDAEGRYRLIDLPPGDYTITAHLAGFARFLRTAVAVRSGLNLPVDIVMTVGGVDEVVEITADTPLLETQSGGRAVNVSGELLRSMPLSERREWYGSLLLAPGVTAADWVNNEKQIYVHGAAPTANVVQVDGADVSPAQAPDVRYLNLSTDAVDDVQVKTAGVDASAPLGVGGIINIATASGTNTVTGAATFAFQPREWNSSNTPGGTSGTVDQRQIDGSIGAPIVKDRLWVFGAYRFVDVSNGVSRTPAQLDALRALVPSFEAFDSTNRAHFSFVKLAAQLSNRHQVSGFYQYDVNPVATAEALTAHPFRDATGGSSASFRLSSVWGQRLTTRLVTSYNDKRRDRLDVGVDEVTTRIFSSTLVSAGRLVGNGRVVDRGSPISALISRPNSKLTAAFDATLFASHSSGTHDLQAGLYAVPRTRIETHTSYLNGGFSLEESVLRVPGAYEAGVVPFHRVILD